MQAILTKWVPQLKPTYSPCSETVLVIIILICIVNLAFSFKLVTAHLNYHLIKGAKKDINHAQLSYASLVAALQNLLNFRFPNTSVELNPSCFSNLYVHIL